MSLLSIVETIRDTKGMNAKKALVEGSEHKDALLNFMANTLNPRINVYQTGIESFGVMQTMMKSKAFKAYCAELEISGIEAAISYTNEASRDGLTRGNEGKLLLAGVYSELDADDKRLYELYVQRDVKCGLGVKTINTIHPDLIPYSPYQRSEGAKPKYYEKLNWEEGVFSQLKADGMFFNGEAELEIMTMIGDIMVTSRSGSLLESPATLDLRQDLADMADHWSLTHPKFNPIFHGELLVVDPDGNTLPREAGNGMLNRVIQTGEAIEEGHTIRAKVWDIIDTDTFKKSVSKKLACGEVYKTRFHELEQIILEVKPKVVELIESRIVYSFDEASAHFQEMLNRGEEGTIIKDADMLWYDGTSQQSLKLKMEMDVDLMIVAMNAGDPNGRHADTFGSLECQSSDGLLSVGVHGLSDALRQDIFDNFEAVWKGSILPVKSNGIIQNRDNPELKSLFLPRVGGERRLDKHEADSLARIIEIQEATIKNGGKTPAEMKA